MVIIHPGSCSQVSTEGFIVVFAGVATPRRKTCMLSCLDKCYVMFFKCNEKKVAKIEL